MIFSKKYSSRAKIIGADGLHQGGVKVEFYTKRAGEKTIWDPTLLFIFGIYYGQPAYYPKKDIEYFRQTPWNE